MGKLKHNYNAFPELQTKFFQKQCMIRSFLQSFNEFHHKMPFQNSKQSFFTNKLYILKISGTIVEQLAMRKKVTTSVISQ